MKRSPQPDDRESPMIEGRQSNGDAETKTPGARTPGVLVTKLCGRRFARFGNPLMIASSNPSLNGRLMLVQSLANPLNHGALHQHRSSVLQPPCLTAQSLSVEKHEMERPIVTIHGF
ncbi:MAG: hypothetical protein M0R03_00275 [Novosphingobium sp.]|nr:hypothetical protein [Novosphingobium sp.]